MQSGELVTFFREQTVIEYYEELSDLKGLLGYMTKELTQLEYNKKGPRGSYLSAG